MPDQARCSIQPSRRNTNLSERHGRPEPIRIYPDINECGIQLNGKATSPSHKEFETVQILFGYPRSGTADVHYHRIL